MGEFSNDSETQKSFDCRHSLSFPSEPQKFVLSLLFISHSCVCTTTSCDNDAVDSTDNGVDHFKPKCFRK